jgi:nicotinamide riboside transporter PnuC
VIKLLIESVGLLALVLSVVGVWHNNRLRKKCFYFWLISNFLSLVIHLWIGLYSFALRDAIFLGLAIEGLWIWRKRMVSNG